MRHYASVPLWRRRLRDPRLWEEQWDATPAPKRFASLLGYAQRVVKLLRKALPDDLTAESPLGGYSFLQDFDRIIVQPARRPPSVSHKEARLIDATHCENKCPARWNLLVSLAQANIMQNGRDAQPGALIGRQGLTTTP